MRCAVLGPLEVRDNRDEIIGVAGAKERQLLAVLAAACPAVVSVDQLLELLWDGEPPRSARKSLQAHVVHLRSALEPERPRGSPGRYVVRRGTGYALALDRDQLDTLAFTDATARGRALVSSGDVAGGYDTLTRALELWRGEPYADWPTSPFAELERHRLQAVRTSAMEALIGAELALGRHVDAAPELERLVLEQPLHETWWELLTLALYRSGRQGDALATVRRARTLLAEELGVDPGPRLRAVEQAVLVQAPELDLAPAPHGNAPLHPGPTQGSARVEGCPYKGLDTYSTQDAAVFRGRHKLVEALLAHLVDHPLLVVSGSSGAGKSSVVRAGVLAALGRGALSGSRHWRQMVITPTTDPVDALAPLTGESKGERPVVLVCDQLEQLWSSETGAGERGAFLDTVLGLLDDGVVARAVLVLRGDYVGRLAEHAAVAEHLVDSLVLVPPLREPELREVVQEPAWAAGLEVEPELVDIVVQEVLGRSGALPLLSAALVGTWQRRRGDLLTLAGYLAAGGVTGAVARTAEGVYAAFDDESREVARRVLVRLADQDERGTIQLRRMPLDELELTGRRRAVVEAMVVQRLLTLDGHSVAVTHEALLHAWPRLAGWLADDAVARSVRRQVAPAAQEWDRNGRPEDDLYRGARLAAASDWATDPDSDVTPVERDFVEASLVRATTELQEARQRADREAAGRRRTRRLAVSLATMLVLALVATASAIGYQQDADLRADEATDARLAADEARLVADANRLAAVAAIARPLDLSLLLAAAAVQLAPTPSTEDGLLSALLTHRRAVAVYPVGSSVNETALGRNGETMIMNVGGGERHVALWEVGSRAAPRRIDDWWPDSLAASPDGKLLVAAGSGSESTIRVYRPDGERVLYMENRADSPGWPREIAFTDDGRLLVVYATPRSDRSGWRTVLAEVDLDTGRVVPLHRLLRSESPDLWFTADFNEDASEVVVWTVQDQSMATRYDVMTGTAVPLRQVRRDATSVDFIALRDETVQTWSDGTVTRYDADGAVVQEMVGHTAVVRDVVEVRDGRGVATVGDGGQAELWDVDRASGRWIRAEALVGHSGHIRQAEVLHDGRTLLTVGTNGRVIAWDLTSGAGLGSATPGLGDRWFSNRIDVVDPGRLVVGPTRPLAGSVRDLVTEGLGTPTATEGFLKLDVAATFLDPRTRRVVDEVEVGQTGATTLFGSSVAVSPDARLVSVTSKYRTTVLDTRTRDVVTTIELPPVDRGEGVEPEPVWCSAWSPDGSELLLCAEGSEDTFEDGGLVVVDTSDWSVDRRVDIGGAAQVLEWAPDHSTLAVGMEHQSVVKLLGPDLVVRGGVQLSDEDQPFDLAFSRDGSLLAAGGAQGLVSVIDPVELRLVREPAEVHSGPVLDVEWLNEGRTVVTTGMDEQATGYDVDRDLVQAEPFPGSPRPGDGYLHMIPSPRGELVLLNGDAHGYRYPLDPARWLAEACGIAGRDLTEDEWARYVPDRAYAPTCSALLEE